MDLGEGTDSNSNTLAAITWSNLPGVALYFCPPIMTSPNQSLKWNVGSHGILGIYSPVRESDFETRLGSCGEWVE